MGGFVKATDESEPNFGNGGFPVAANFKIPASDETLSEFQNFNISQATEFTPQYVALDGKVLRFDAYVREDVPTIPNEGFRIRNFTIYYFLVDDSIRIGETKQENSGLAQGVFLKRHRVPRSAPSSAPPTDRSAHSEPPLTSRSRGKFLTWEDLQIGAELEIYGKTFVLTACDSFTRNFFAAKGAPQGAPIAPPTDPYLGRRHGAGPRAAAARPPGDPRARFLASNRRVLRFFCVWDDRRAVYGARRPFVLRFYLEDDTVEVGEVRTPNDGRHAFPKFLRRQQLPKDAATALQDIGSRPARFYTDADFTVGDRSAATRRRKLPPPLPIYI
jgi:EF-hand domain-containing protein 1